MWTFVVPMPCAGDVPDHYIQKVAQVMAAAHWHTFQVLTKRSARMSEMLSGPLAPYAAMNHIWWGVSVENRRYGLPRIEDLRSAPARIRFLSVEPLLEDLGAIDLDGISWVIVGGESGPGARPMEKKWVLSVRDQCKTARVPFFFKQWGGIQKKRAGRLLNGRTYDQFPKLLDRAGHVKNVQSQEILDQDAAPTSGLTIL